MLLAYARVSTLEQAKDDRTSLQEQERIIRGFAMAKGYHAYDVQMYVDAGVTGTMALKYRPAGAELIEDMKPGDVVVAASLDRMFRSARDALDTAALFKEKGIDLILFNFGMEPIAKSAFAECFFTMAAAFAQLERATINERILRGRKAKKAKGGHAGGVAQYGYRVVGSGREARVEINEEEQQRIAMIKELAHMYPHSTVMARLKHQGIKTRTGKDWDYTQIQRILTKPPIEVHH